MYVIYNIEVGLVRIMDHLSEMKLASAHSCFFVSVEHE